MYGARRRATTPHDHAGGTRGRRAAAGCRAHPRRAHRRQTFDRARRRPPCDRLHRMRCLAGLRDAYRPGASVADAFARWLESVLGRLGLVVFEASDPAAKPLAADVFAHELRNAGHDCLARGRGRPDDCRRSGMHRRSSRSRTSVALFHLDGARTPIRHSGDAFVIGEQTVAAATLIEQAQRSPARSAPTSCSARSSRTRSSRRSVMWGPSEMAYLGQLGGVYQQFGLPMPLIVARAHRDAVDRRPRDSCALPGHVRGSPAAGRVRAQSGARTRSCRSRSSRRCARRARRCNGA